MIKGLFKTLMQRRKCTVVSGVMDGDVLLSAKNAACRTLDETARHLKWLKV